MSGLQMIGSLARVTKMRAVRDSETAGLRSEKERERAVRERRILFLVKRHISHRLVIGCFALFCKAATTTRPSSTMFWMLTVLNSMDVVSTKLTFVCVNIRETCHHRASSAVEKRARSSLNAGRIPQNQLEITKPTTTSATQL